MSKITSNIESHCVEQKAVIEWSVGDVCNWLASIADVVVAVVTATVEVIEVVGNTYA